MGDKPSCPVKAANAEQQQADGNFLVVAQTTGEDEVKRSLPHTADTAAGDAKQAQAAETNTPDGAVQQATVPRGPDGLVSNGAQQALPSEPDILAELVRYLGSSGSCPIQGIIERLPERWREAAGEKEQIIRWLAKFQGLFAVEGPPGEETVTLLLGNSSKPEKAAAAAAPQAQAPIGQNAPQAASKALNRTQTLGIDEVRPTMLEGLPIMPEKEDEVVNPASVQLRGLPFRATIADIKEFLGPHADMLAPSETSIRMLLNRDQRPSGFARVQFASVEAAFAAREALHKKMIGDRYIEVLNCNERDRKARRGPLRGVGDDGETSIACDPGAIGQRPSLTEAEEQERVLQECREHMIQHQQQSPKQPVLLSMLGIALSDGARKYLRRLNIGLKHFLTRFPQFRVEGPKGVEKVVWIRDGHLTQLPVDFGSGCLDAGSLDPGQEPSTPQATRVAETILAGQLSAGGPSSEDARYNSTPIQGTPGASGGGPTSDDHYNNTPSQWGTPGPCGPAGAMASQAQHHPLDFGSSSYMPWPGAWDTSAWAWMNAAANGSGANGMEGRHGKLAATEAASARRSHAHLHPHSHPFARGRTSGNMQPEGVSEYDGPPTSVPAVRLRGLPFDTSSQDVLAFFGHNDVADGIADGPNIVHMLQKANGRPSGQAVVQMRSRAHADQAFAALNNKKLGGRYIEVFVYGDTSGEVNQPPPGLHPQMQASMTDMAGALSSDWGVPEGSSPWGWSSADVYSGALSSHLLENVMGLDGSTYGAFSGLSHPGSGFDAAMLDGIWASKVPQGGLSSSAGGVGGDDLAAGGTVALTAPTPPGVTRQTV
mmetsp:Transcript_58775/g.137216  ORF Transcript_58775/g.137216 Transcript_58775/m.137216 type:complete len:826 (+) Transcript_58775:177-2654(+)